MTGKYNNLGSWNRKLIKAAIRAVKAIDVMKHLTSDYVRQKLYSLRVPGQF